MSDSENIHLLFDMLNNSNLQLELEENFEDGRLNSSFNEEVVLNYIKQIIEENEYDFEKAPAREWYDFKFNGTPFNLKISNMSGADNVSSKKGLVYALTGKLPNNTHQNCLDLLESDFVDSDEYDYGFLIVDKNTKKLNILAKPENEKSKIEIVGNSNLKEGENIIKIIVTAEDGTTTRTYKINAYDNYLILTIL